MDRDFGASVSGVLYCQRHSKHSEENWPHGAINTSNPQGAYVHSVQANH